MQSVPITTKVTNLISCKWQHVLNTTLYVPVYLRYLEDQWFSPGTPVFYTKKKNSSQNITEILSRVALNTHIPVFKLNDTTDICILNYFLSRNSIKMSIFAVI